MGLSVSGSEATKNFEREGLCRIPLFRLEGSKPDGWDRQRAVPALYLVDMEGKVKASYVGERSIIADRNILTSFLDRLESKNGFPAP